MKVELRLVLAILLSVAILICIGGAFFAFLYLDTHNSATLPAPTYLDDDVQYFPAPMYLEDDVQYFPAQTP